MSDYKHGTCAWCSSDGDVFQDNLLCGDCDSNTIFCFICRSRQHRDGSCRHIFQDRHFEWQGSGVSPTSQDMHVPFHRLLSAMPDGFAVDLKGAIRRGNFYTWLVAPMIGSGGILELHGIANDTYGDALLDLGSGPRADELADGYHWLASLYRRKTTKANRTTIAWIDQWLWPLTPLPRQEQR